MLRTAVASVAILLSAVAVCSDDESLAPVLYHGSVSVTSQRKAYVELVTGEAKRHRIDEDILPHWITKGSWESRHPNLHGTFGAEDEEKFAESFVSELVRLGLFKQAVETSGEKSEDVHMRLWFAKTEYFSQGATRYVLYVEMQIEDQGGVSSRRYVADSRNAVSLVKGDQYGRALAKTAAATDLMEKLIPDVGEWLRQDQATRKTGATPTAAAQEDPSLAAAHPPVSPNQDFSNPILKLRAPRSDGWHGLEQSSTRIAFAKSGSDADESFVAAVFLLRIPTFPNSDAFTAYVREGIIKDSPPDRFETIELNVQYSPEREYPCVRYRGISNDRKAHTSVFGRKKLRVEVIGLYCEYPSKPGLAFYVSFSHRGGSPDVRIDDDAAAFIESVQVTPPSKAP